MDEVLAAYMPGPKSFTGENMVEIYCHSGQIVLTTILKTIIDNNCRPAEAGEFSLRRFFNHGEDISRLEGAADIVAAKTDLAYRLSREHLTGQYGEHISNIRNDITYLLAEIEADIDFPDEDDIGTIGQELLKKRIDDISRRLQQLAESYRTGKIISDGFRVLILGPPNAGKSLLFNRLVKRNRALVTPVPGTTRDYISEWIDINGLPVELFDTAGMRKGRGQIEKAGIDAARKLISQADMIIYLFDINKRTEPLPQFKLNKNAKLVIALNKIDICKNVDSKFNLWKNGLDSKYELISLSAKTGKGIKTLTNKIYETAGITDLTESLVVTSNRHKIKIDKCLSHLSKIRKMTKAPVEIISWELRQAAESIGEITGHIYTEEILEEIFSNFCIGK